MSSPVIPGNGESATAPPAIAMIAKTRYNNPSNIQAGPKAP
jgi:hypothetical protein